MQVEDIQPDELDESNALRHIKKVHDRLELLRDHIRKDIERMDEPQAKAMFETSAEVLEGLIDTFEDYVENDEDAWTHEEIINATPGC